MSDEAPRYPVGTIAQMAAIPLEARPRFLAELPRLLEIVDQAAAFNAMDIIPGCKLEMRTPLWVDDDKGATTISVTVPA